MSLRKQRLGRSKKLKSRKEIEAIFHCNKQVFSHPIKMLFLHEKADNSAFKIAFAVSKKALRRAVHRNRTKRLLRETFRLSQQELIFQGKLSIVCIYIGNIVPDYKTIDAAMRRCLMKLNSFIQSADTQAQA